MGLSKSSAFGSGQYLSQKDAATPIRATIQDVRMETLRGDNGDEEKMVCHFQEKGIKPFIVNTTNWEIIEQMCGCHDDTDTWIGKQIEVYVDPGVMFAGKRTGGLRVRPVTQITPAVERAMNGQYTWEEAIKETVLHGKTKEDLVAMLKASGATSYNELLHSKLVKRWLADISIPF